MSLPALSLGLRFCTSRKGGTGGGGQVSTMGPGNVAASGFSCRKPLVGTGWAISLLLCTNGLSKWSSGHVRPPFPKLVTVLEYSQKLHKAAVGIAKVD